MIALGSACGFVWKRGLGCIGGGGVGLVVKQNTPMYQTLYHLYTYQILNGPCVKHFSKYLQSLKFCFAFTSNLQLIKHLYFDS